MIATSLEIGLVGYGLAGKVFHTPLYEAASVELAAVATSNAANVLADHPSVRINKYYFSGRFCSIGTDSGGPLDEDAARIAIRQPIKEEGESINDDAL